MNQCGPGMDRRALHCNIVSAPQSNRLAMKLPVGHVAGKGVERASGFGGYGQRMLEKLGWQKGQGLGTNKDGITEAIEVKKKEDTLGVRGPSALAYWALAWHAVDNRCIAPLLAACVGGCRCGAYLGLDVQVLGAGLRRRHEGY